MNAITGLWHSPAVIAPNDRSFKATSTATDTRLQTVHPQQLESLTKAGQCADLLASDIREAQRLARKDQPLLAILLWELLGEVNRIRNRLAELQSTAHE